VSVRSIRGLLAALVALAPLGLSAVSSASDGATDNPSISYMDVRGGHDGDGADAQRVHSGAAGRATRVVRGANGINYNGGPVMSAPTTAYVIWYGSWASTPAKTGIISDFLSTVGGSPYFNVNTTYTDKTGAHVQNNVKLGAQATDTGSVGLTNLTDAQILTIVQRAISNGLPKDPNGVYFVLTSSNVTKTGFLTSYCGWHSAATIAATTIKYSFVGDPTGPRIGNCSAQTASSPNGDPGADAMTSVIAHELEETVTDPNLNAWYDSRGNENADKCAWTFGTTYRAANGSTANMKLGTRDFLIQRNWINANGGGCTLAL
jgi:hypothetical protein